MKDYQSGNVGTRAGDPCERCDETWKYSLVQNGNKQAVEKR